MDETNPILPWKANIDPTPEITLPDKKNSNKKELTIFLIGAAIIYFGAIFFVMGPPISLNDLKSANLLSQSKKYETKNYELLLPRGWKGSVNNEGLLSASDPEKPIHRVTISRYNQLLRKEYREVAKKSNNFSYVRYLTAECSNDKLKGKVCSRVYYLWNENETVIVRLMIDWEQWSFEEIAKSEENVKKAQKEGVVQADPSIEKVEKMIFESFRFKN